MSSSSQDSDEPSSSVWKQTITMGGIAHQKRVEKLTELFEEHSLDVINLERKLAEIPGCREDLDNLFATLRSERARYDDLDEQGGA